MRELVCILGPQFSLQSNIYHWRKFCEPSVKNFAILFTSNCISSQYNFDTILSKFLISNEVIIYIQR